MTPSQVEIYCAGRICVVTDAQFEELMQRRIDWLAYCIARQHAGHDEAIRSLQICPAPVTSVFG